MFYLFAKIIINQIIILRTIIQKLMNFAFINSIIIIYKFSLLFSNYNIYYSYSYFIYILIILHLLK